MSTERVRKPRDHKPYERKAPKVDKNAPKTSAKPLQSSKDNLTLADWLMVVSYADANKNLTQTDIVNYFAQRPEGALTFGQSALSRHLSPKGRQSDQAKLASSPNAINTKRLRVVARPDVDQALVLWVRHLEEKGEHVTGPMLAAKRTKFEDQLAVPDAERMKSDGWIAKFTKA